MKMEWRRRSELNRRIEVLQTSALPLGYAAKKRKTRFELATSTLARWSSTTELLPRKVRPIISSRGTYCQLNFKIDHSRIIIGISRKTKAYPRCAKIVNYHIDNTKHTIVAPYCRSRSHRLMFLFIWLFFHDRPAEADRWSIRLQLSTKKSFNQ